MFRSLNNKLRRMCVMVLTSIVAFSSMAFMPSVVSAGDDYPHMDPWGFAINNCTSFVAWRMNRDHSSNAAPWYFYIDMIGPNGKKGNFGDAHNWDNNAAAIGFKVSTVAHPGDVAVWNALQGGAGKYGHVAYVESVNADGSVNISEYNWDKAIGSYSTRSNVKANYYITINPRNLQLVPAKSYNYPVYRFKNLETRARFFTISESEAKKMMNYAVWMPESVAFYAPKTNADSIAVPVYRFLNTKNNGQLFTVSESEKTKVMSLSGYKYEGIAFYAYTPNIPGTGGWITIPMINKKPVYRLYNLSSGYHLFTASESEKTKLSSSSDWKYEGIAFYVNNL